MRGGRNCRGRKEREILEIIWMGYKRETGGEVTVGRERGERQQESITFNTCYSLKGVHPFSHLFQPDRRKMDENAINIVLYCDICNIMPLEFVPP